MSDPPKGKVIQAIADNSSTNSTDVCMNRAKYEKFLAHQPTALNVSTTIVSATSSSDVFSVGSPRNHMWIIDLGASFHFCRNILCFDFLISNPLKHVCLIDENLSPIKGQRDVKLSS